MLESKTVEGAGTANPFDAATPEYARVRPVYPPAAVDAVLAGGRPGSTPARVVADIGAGTGKMTSLLVERGLEVHAVEPAAAMREHLSEVAGTGSVVIHPTSAEASGLDAASVDVAVFAQSWHWVDPEAAGRELSRIVRPGGAAVAVWNQLDVQVAWIHRLTRIMRSGDVHRVDDPPLFGPGFTEPRVEVFSWVDQVSPEEIVELGRTRSAWLRSSAADRERMQDNLKWYLYEHLGYSVGQSIHLPYSTLVWSAQRV